MGGSLTGVLRLEENAAVGEKTERRLIKHTRYCWLLFKVATLQRFLPLPRFRLVTRWLHPGIKEILQNLLVRQPRMYRMLPHQVSGRIAFSPLHQLPKDLFPQIDLRACACERNIRCRSRT